MRGRGGGKERERGEGRRESRGNKIHHYGKQMSIKNILKNVQFNNQLEPYKAIECYYTCMFNRAHNVTMFSN